MEIINDYFNPDALCSLVGCFLTIILILFGSGAYSFGPNRPIGIESSRIDGRYFINLKQLFPRVT